MWTLDALVSILLNFFLAKPIAIFVWWLHARANHTSFHGRAELARRVKQARQAGVPVLFASNHISMFDDPVAPMALFRTGPRAAVELACLVALLLLWRLAPPTIAPPEAFLACCIGYSLGIAVLGARKIWWSIGDLVNFSGASALRAKLESGRNRPLSRLERVFLAALDPVVFFFMRSATVKTVLVDRRPGEDGKRSRTRAAERGIELAARGEQIWVFFEGGRSRIPDEIRPARSGIGLMIKGLHSRGVRPVVIAVHHRGLEHVIPISSRRWLTSGHEIDIRWAEFGVDEEASCGLADRSAQEIADEIREVVVRLQSEWRTERSSDA